LIKHGTSSERYLNEAVKIIENTEIISNEMEVNKQFREQETLSPVTSQKSNINSPREE
jgi:hypothetical protein